MRKFIVLIALAFCCVMSSYGQIDNMDTKTKTPAETKAFVGLSYYGFDGFKNWGLTVQGIKHNGVFGELALRANFDDHGNYNVDLGINYSYAVLSSDDVKIYLTAAVGPSLRFQEVYKGSETIVNEHHSLALGDYTTSYTKENWENKFFVDCYLNLRATISYKCVAVSGGYYFWAPKFKFGKDYNAHGFVASVGIIF